MTLQVHVGPSADGLVDALADLLDEAPEDPFARELVVVPARGVERWLSQRLSHRLGAGSGGVEDGVTAAVDFLSPWSLTAVLAGRDEHDPWHPERLTWSVLAVIDDLLALDTAGGSPPWARALLHHLGRGEQERPGASGQAGQLRLARRWSTAGRLARLFAGYAVQRPTLVEAWQSGADEDGLGRALAEDLAWQPHLWRRVRDHVVAAGGADPVTAHAAALASLRQARDGGGAAELPPRLSVFGHTRFARTELQLLAAAAEQREVHLWLPVASPGAWQQLAPLYAAGLDGAGLAGAGPAGAGAVTAPSPPAPLPRADDTSVRAVRHPLVRALGRDVRELQQSLATVAGAAAVDHLASPTSSGLSQPGGAGGSLLGWLQADLRSDALPDEDERRRRSLAPGDPRLESIEVHACHGLSRQVEVLRDVLLGMLADDPTLEPRDIVVMCPDVEAVAPLAAAVFGLADGRPAGAAERGRHPGEQLRVALADRGVARTNPMLALAAALLDLVDGRATVAHVLSVLDSAPVRRRFRLDDDAMEQLRTWVVGADVRWGLDVEGRKPFGLTGLAQNTWRTGLDRLLLGVAMAEPDGPWAGAVPVDSVSSADLDLVGRLTEAVARIGTAVGRLASAGALSEWVEHLTWAVEALGLPVRGEEWQLHELREEFADLLRGAGVEPAAIDTGEPRGPRGPMLSLPEIRSLLEHRLAPRPTRSSFRTGAITICTMVPMRAVPHRVVCLLGLDDGRFPRDPVPDGDDVLARTPVVGERDARTEDRQLLLDAVAAAGEKLVVLYSGHDERSGSPRPPAVPLGDLLDAVDATAYATEEREQHGEQQVPVRRLITRQHPLQPVDPRHHVPGALGVGPTGADARPFSFDEAAAAGARAWVGERRPAARWSGVRLPARPADERAATTMKELQDFFAHPVRAFVRQRLDVAMPEWVDELPEALPIDLDHLAQWQVGDRMLRQVLGGADPRRVRAAEEVRGSLPPGAMGLGQLDRIEQQAGELFTATVDLRTRQARSVDVDVLLPDGRRVTGSVADVRGSQVVRVEYSSLSAKRRLAAWIDLVALTAADPDHAWSAVIVGKHRAGPRMARLEQIEDDAQALLMDLLDVREEGLCAPLPLHPKLAWAWIEETRSEGRSAFSARKEWQGAFGSDSGLDEDPAHLLVYGRRPDWRVVQGRASAHEQWHPEATSRLGQYAWRVWQPLLERERMGPA